MQWEAQGASLDHLVGGAKLNSGPPPAAPESAPMKIETIITTTNMGVPKPLIHPEPLIRDPKRERRQKKDGPKVNAVNTAARKMLESRSEDALVLLVKLVKSTVETVATVETV